MFCKRLDFLMRLTRTSNAALASAIAMAPSYISKLRSGSRSLPKRADFVSYICDYFAKRINDPEQLDALNGLLQKGETFPDDPQLRSKILYRWLMSEDADSPLMPQTAPAAARHMKTYFGIEGRREAILHLQTEVLKKAVPQTLLLYSDESLDWLIEDSAYGKRWRDQMLELFQRGHRLITIHSSHRSADMTYHALQSWLPLYVTSSVEIFYCPKIMDELFFHTFYIAPGTAAITAFSASRDSKETMCTYYVNPQAIEVLTNTFQSFLKKCRPLFHSYTMHTIEDFSKRLDYFSSIDNNSSHLVSSLSPLTIPEANLQSIKMRTGIRIPDAIFRFEKGLRQQLEHYSCYDTFALPDPDLVRSEKCPAPLLLGFDDPGVNYTPKEVITHLELVLELMDSYDSYQPSLLKSCDFNYAIFVKEQVGVVISDTSSGLHLVQSDFIADDYWDYLEMIRKQRNILSNQTLVRQTIQKYIAALKQ